MLKFIGYNSVIKPYLYNAFNKIILYSATIKNDFYQSHRSKGYVTAKGDILQCWFEISHLAILIIEIL